MPVPSLLSDPESNCKMSSNDVVRIAIQNTVGSKSGSGGGIGINHLMQLAKNSELSAVVKELCGIWKLDRPEDYALK